MKVGISALIFLAVLVISGGVLLVTPPGQLTGGSAAFVGGIVICGGIALMALNGGVKT